MINVSFYLLTPDAKNSSNLYVSISSNGERIRFWTGHSLLIKYCNVRKKKGQKDLIKKNTPFYYEYSELVNDIQEQLHKIDFRIFKEKGKQSLELIRAQYEKESVHFKTGDDFYSTFDQFVERSESGWTNGTRKHYFTLRNHLIEAEKQNTNLNLDFFDGSSWRIIRDNYFVQHLELSNNTINANLKKLKNFLKFYLKETGSYDRTNWDEFTLLKEIEPYRIALREEEVKAIIDLDLSDDPSRDRVRDLFVLEIYTGQRFSDIPKVLNADNITENQIQLYQQKTGEKVSIPLHKNLKDHLGKILDKYGDSLPTMSNQKFNENIKIICESAGLNRKHSWTKMSGVDKITVTEKRFNLVSSHTGRRTFCTLALKNNIPAEIIMKVTGHRKYDQFKEYVRVDDTDVDEAFNKVKLIN